MARWGTALLSTGMLLACDSGTPPSSPTPTDVLFMTLSLEKDSVESVRELRVFATVENRSGAPEVINPSLFQNPSMALLFLKPDGEPIVSQTPIAPPAGRDEATLKPGERMSFTYSMDALPEELPEGSYRIKSAILHSNEVRFVIR